MSRSGYTDDCDDQWGHIRWRGMVSSATRGRRGQAFFRALVEALDAMPVKELTGHELESPDGEVCALGALGRARGLDMKGVYDPEADDGWGEQADEMAAWAAKHFDIADCLAREVVYMNDEGSPDDPGKRWQQMRKWAAAQIKPSPTPPPSEGGA